MTVTEPKSMLDSLSWNNKYGKLCTHAFPNKNSRLFSIHDTVKIDIAVDGNISNRNIFIEELGLNKESDCTVIITEVYKKLGYEGLLRLEGYFTFILVDEEQNKSFLFRSFLTGFPLYYVVKNSLLTVSTNLIDLLYRSDISDTLNMTHISALFSLDTDALTDSVFKEINEVSQGELLLFTANNIQSLKKPLGDIFTPIKHGSEEKMISGYKDLLFDSIEKNILPNKRYGIMLSSGMDSGTLAALTTLKLRERDEKLQAFSWSLPSYPIADESQQIETFCHELNIDLKLINVERDDPFSNLDKLFVYAASPQSNLYNRMISHIYAKASQEGIDILLNGHYGDELFLPFDSLFVDMMKNKKFALILPELISLMQRHGYKNVWNHPTVRTFIKWVIPFYKEKKLPFRNEEWLTSEAKESRYMAWKKQKKKSEMDFAQFRSALGIFNTGNGSTRYMTGKFGLERIEPFADIALLNYCLQLPTHMVYRKGQTKYFAREAMRGILPEYIRTQSRVGLLGEFAINSFRKNRKEVRERLFDERVYWNRYVDETWMYKKFKYPLEMEGKELLVIWMALNMGVWKKAIRPGGSLYES